MDNEDEEAPSKPSPPLQQHSVDLTSTASASQCDTDPQSFPNAGAGDMIEAELCEEGNAVDAGTSKDNKAEAVEEEDPVVGEVAGTTEAVVVAADTMVLEEREVADLANEGQEMQVMDDKGNEIVEDSVVLGMDDTEKGNGSGLVGMEEEVIEGNGNGNDRVDEGTHVDDVAVEEEDGADDDAHKAHMAIGQTQTTEDEIRDEGTEAPNEAALMEQEEQVQEQEQEQEQADAGGMAQDTEAATLIEEEEEEEDEEEPEEADAAGAGGMAEGTEVAEDVEVAEEQSRSVSGGKRKRGPGKNSKSSGRVPSRKKMEEDVCFICFDGGDLVLCDRR